jgi:dinuclear metal center YbgI/SA1388 family protein
VAVQVARVQDVVAFLEQLAPPALAEDWDNVGLLLGERNNEVHRVLTCLTITPPVVAEAAAEKVSLIVSHHPILFRPIQQITGDDAEGRILLDLIRAGIAVYSPHTAYDSAAAGINQQLADLLGLQDIAPLRTLHPNANEASDTGVLAMECEPSAGRQCKLAVFVPEDSLEAVARAVFDAGAGRIGEYSECSFRTAGTGTFFGSDAATPAVGRKGRREEVAEYRLEVLCPRDRLAEITAALRRAHPYEEPAFDVYPLLDARAARKAHPSGAGRHGRFANPVTTAGLIQRIKASLKTPHVGLVGEPNAMLATLAVACGSAGEFLSDASRSGCDALLTGETRFHTLLDAQALGITLLMPGHYATERFAVETLAARIGERFPKLPVHASRSDRDPLSWL